MLKKTIRCASFLVIIIIVTSLSGTAMAANAQDDASYWAPVEKAMGVHGDISNDGVASFSIPRNLTVTIDGIRRAQGSDTSSDFNFMREGNESLMVGEIMLKDDEVPGVARQLLAAGIEESALHNHLLRETPHIMWLHVHAHGDPVRIASNLRNITGSLDNDSPPASTGMPVSRLDTAGLDRILGANGTVKEGVYAYKIPRADTITMNGVTLAPDMDMSTEISFQPLGGGKAAAIGEYVLEEAEVEPVLSTLTNNGVEVTALHSHMITEKPRLFYLHCWATGNSTDIANAMRKALDKTNRAFA